MAILLRCFGSGVIVEFEDYSVEISEIRGMSWGENRAYLPTGEPSTARSKKRRGLTMVEVYF